jgi:hypothetical protein
MNQPLNRICRGEEKKAVSKFSSDFLQNGIVSESFVVLPVEFLASDLYNTRSDSSFRG